MRWLCLPLVAAGLGSMVSADGPDSPGTDPRSVVRLDGTTNPGAVEAKGIEGTEADVRVKVSTQGTYQLKNTLGTVVSTADSIDLNVTFEGIDLATNGWYSVVNALGLEITKFQVIDYDGGNLNHAAYNVITFTTAQLILMADGGIFDTQGLFISAFRTPPCGKYGTDDPDQTVPISQNTVTRFRFVTPYYVQAAISVPIVGAMLETRGDVDPVPSPNVGNNVVWIHSYYPAPIGDNPPLERQLTSQATVHLSTLSQVRLDAYGYVEIRDPLQGYHFECQDQTDKVKITVTM